MKNTLITGAGLASALLLGTAMVSGCNRSAQNADTATTAADTTPVAPGQATGNAAGTSGATSTAATTPAPTPAAATPC